MREIRTDKKILHYVLRDSDELKETNSKLVFSNAVFITSHFDVQAWHFNCSENEYMTAPAWALSLFFFFFSLVLVTFVFLSRTGNMLTLPERKRHEKTERKKPFKAAAQTRTAFIDRQTKGLNASGTGTDEASVLKMTFSKQLIYLQLVSPCSLQYGSVMNTALYSTSDKMQHSCCRNVFFSWEASDGERSASDWKLPEGVNSSAETDSLKLSCKLSFDKRQRCSADKLII